MSYEPNIELRTDAASRIGRVIGTVFACVLVLALVLIYAGFRA